MLIVSKQLVYLQNRSPYIHVNLEQTWSRVTDVCIAYQSTVPFVAKLLLQWDYKPRPCAYVCIKNYCRNICVFVVCEVQYENVIHRIRYFFSRLSTHTLVSCRSFILFEIRNLQLFQTSTTVWLHTNTHTHGDFHEFPTHKTIREREGKKKPTVIPYHDQ